MYHSIFKRNHSTWRRSIPGMGRGGSASLSHRHITPTRGVDGSKADGSLRWEMRYSSLSTCSKQVSISFQFMRCFICDASYAMQYTPNSFQCINPTQPNPFIPFEYLVFPAHATAKLNKLPAVSPNTSISPMNPPAASLSSTSTHPAAPIMHVDPRYPLLNPKRNCTMTR